MAILARHHLSEMAIKPLTNFSQVRWLGQYKPKPPPCGQGLLQDPISHRSAREPVIYGIHGPWRGWLKWESEGNGEGS